MFLKVEHPVVDIQQADTARQTFVNTCPFFYTEEQRQKVVIAALLTLSEHWSETEVYIVYAAWYWYSLSSSGPQLPISYSKEIHSEKNYKNHLAQYTQVDSSMCCLTSLQYLIQ